jgi:hypothetical protein
MISLLAVCGGAVLALAEFLLLEMAHGIAGNSAVLAYSPWRRPPLTLLFGTRTPAAAGLVVTEAEPVTRVPFQPHNRRPSPHLGILGSQAG